MPMNTIKRIKAIYFSPCGHTARLAQSLAQELSKAMALPWESMDFTRPIQRQGGPWALAATDLVIFASPTYAGRLPNKALPWIQSLFQGQKTPTIALVTFGNRNFDSSLAELVQELGLLGFHVLAGAALASTHVFAPETIGPGRPDVQDQKDLQAFGKKIASLLVEAQDLSHLTDLPEVLIEAGSPVAPYYTPRKVDGTPAKFLNAKPVTDLSKCTQCGTCVEVCPMGSIDPADVTSTPGTCIKCQACLRYCPTGAKTFTDPDFLSHVKMLEENYTKRANPAFYVSRDGVFSAS